MTLPSTVGGERPSLQWSLAGRFALSIRRDKHGPETKRVPVPAAFLRDFQQELLLKYALRCGMPDATLDDMTMEMTPLYDDRGPVRSAVDYSVDVVNPRGEIFQQDYNVYLFSDVASRAVGDLVAEGILKLEDNYYYELVVDEPCRCLAGPELGRPCLSARDRRRSRSATSRCLLSPLMAAGPSGRRTEPRPNHFPVFYTAEAYERAERFCAPRCRRPAASRNGGRADRHRHVPVPNRASSTS